MLLPSDLTDPDERAIWCAAWVVARSHCAQPEDAKRAAMVYLREFRELSRREKEMPDVHVAVSPEAVEEVLAEQEGRSDG